MRYRGGRRVPWGRRRCAAAATVGVINTRFHGMYTDYMVKRLRGDTRLYGYNVSTKTDLKVLGYRELSVHGGGGVVSRVSVVDRNENRGGYPPTPTIDPPQRVCVCV